MTTRLVNNAFSAILIFATASIISNAGAADPCFDIQDPDHGSTGNCIPSSACSTNITVPNVCPSFPSDHVCCFSDLFPGRESRGAWIATVTNIDWPNSPLDSVAVQKASLESLIDALESTGINAIYFQVRPAGDALYQSDIEPWSRYLTGTQGFAPIPLWDPLDHVIAYAHGKSMEVHAWINPYRANMVASDADLAPNHMAKQFPQYAYPYSTYLWMDPGAQEVQNRTTSVVVDLVTRYDLDGIHMDDYFYPYPVANVPFPDDQTYADYIENEGGILAKDDWRRENVNKLIRRLNDEIHGVKPFIKFSISPFGIYRPCEEGGMPCSINGFDQYSQIYCDAKLWLMEGWIDILQPQLYWKIDPVAQSYPVLLDWWVSQNPHGRHVYAGNYLSRVLDGWPLSELTDQVTISRRNEHRSRGSWGNVQFSAKIFQDNYEGAVQHFKQNVYQFPALPPPFPWLAKKSVKKNNHNKHASRQRQPAPLFKKTKHGRLHMLNHSSYKHRQDEQLRHKIVIYEKTKDGSSWTIKQVIRESESNGHFNRLKIKLEQPGHYAISSLDRYGEESEKFYYRQN